jgi:spore coat polysaccharide biosynthesis protein SpsF
MRDFGIVTIVQCRAGSSRLKGKALKPLAGRPMLSHVLSRAKEVGCPVVLATSTAPGDGPVERLGTKEGVKVFRGDEKDVLSRVAGAARRYRARIVARVTGDCPLFAPDVARLVMELFIQGGYDQTCDLGVIATADTAVSGWPDGFDIEVFRAADLYAADEWATDEQDREHVTPWLLRALPKVTLPCPERIKVPKLSVDTQADFDFVASVFGYLDNGDTSWRATVAAAEAAAQARRDRGTRKKKAGKKKVAKAVTA